MTPDLKTRTTPVPTIRRLPSYLRRLRELRAEGVEFVSATQLAEELALESIQVRKDLGYTGLVGKPRVGFVVAEAIERITALLNWKETADAVVVGAGHLGSALLGYEGFHLHGLEVVAAFEKDATKAGTRIHGKPVFAMEQLAEQIARMGVRIAILTVPASAAQAAADRLVEAGIEGIWNFTPIQLRVPERVVVQQEDLARGLAVLSVQLASRGDADSRDGAPEAA